MALAHKTVRTMSASETRAFWSAGKARNVR
jgi:hypothetical protein